MANTTSQIKIVFDGAAKGVVAAAAETKAALKSVDDENNRVAKSADKVFKATGTAAKGILAVGSAANAGGAVVGLAGSLVTMSGILAEVPAIALAGAAGLATYKLAVSGVGDAFKAALANDPAKYAEAVAKLAPAARDTAGAVRELYPDLHNLQQSVQDRFFQGFADDVRGLGQTYLPVLNTGLVKTAGSMNDMGRYAAKALMDPAQVTAVNTVLGGTNDLFAGMENVVGDVLAGTLQLGSAGSASLGGLGDAVGKAAAKYRDWATAAVESGRAQEWIKEAKAEIADYGTVLTNVGSIGTTVFRGLSSGGLDFSASLVETTTRLDEFLKTAEGQEALKQLGETLKVAGDTAREILLVALQELAPVIVDIAPAAREFATAVGDNIVSALRTAGPILQDVATFLSDHKEIIGDLVPILLTAAAGYKGLQVANNVAGWIAGATTAIQGAGKAAGDADGKVGGLAGKLGGLKAVGAGILITIGLIGLEEALKGLDSVADGIRKIPEPDRSGWDKFILAVDDAADSTTNLQDKFKNTNWNDFWDPNNALSSRIQGTKRLIEGWHPTPIELGLNDQPARTALTTFMGEVNGQAPEININGRTEGAAQALADIVQAINRGEGSVKINGVDTPVQDALKRVVDAINISVGTVQVDGETKLAGDALRDWIMEAQKPGGGPKVPVTAETPDPQTLGDGIRGALLSAGPYTIPVTADTIQASTSIGVIKQSIEEPNTKPVLGDPADILGKLADVDQKATTPQTKPLLGDPAGVLGDIAGADAAQTTPQTKPLLGNPASVLQDVSNVDKAQTTPQTKPLLGNNSQGVAQVNDLDAKGRAPVTKPIQSRDENSQSVFDSIFAVFAKPIVQVVRVVQEIFSAGGGAVGPVPGLAVGGVPTYKGHVTGAIYGPGTGTSDQAGLYRLSNGEHVLTAAEVRALGGQEAVYRLRAMIRAGMVPGFASGGSPGTVGSDGAAAPTVDVTVLIDGEEFRGMIDSRIRTADRATARTARVGAGVGWGF